MLAEDDWIALEFYQRVREQYVNQTPMGAGKGQPMHLSPNMLGYQSALELYDYPRWMWDWLIRWGVTLHHLVHDMDKVNSVDWFREFGRKRDDVSIEELL